MLPKLLAISIAVMFLSLFPIKGLLKSQEQQMYYNMTDLKWLSIAIYFEARSESTAGQIAVAQVVVNRVYSSRWPDTIKGVVTQGKYKDGLPVLNKCNFSFWCDGRTEEILNDKAWDKAINISRLVIAGNIIDITDGADHYELKINSPWWSKNMLPTAYIDSHIFYKSNNP
jgi:N-acetylmuramoyl-L-alanine amidase